MMHSRPKIVHTEIEFSLKYETDVRNKHKLRIFSNVPHPSPYARGERDYYGVCCFRLQWLAGYHSVTHTLHSTLALHWKCEQEHGAFTAFIYYSLT